MPGVTATSRPTLPNSSTGAAPPGTPSSIPVEPKPSPDAQPERASTIEPAIEHAVRVGIDASGPFPADTVFNRAVRGARGGGRYDLVVAMYHDQGLIPVKLLARDESVNVTLGLPVARTSPDHGTAFDIAGRGVADPGSMSAAVDLAVRIATPAHAPADA